MAVPVPNQAFLFAALIDIITNVFGTSTHSKCRLYTNTIAPQPTSLPGDFTPATFDGYADISIAAWGTPHLLQNGQVAVAPATPLTFTPTGSTTPNTITGYILLDAAGALIQAENFVPPITLSGPTTTLQFVPEVAMAPWQTQTVIVP
jgi:hypothetical protein